MVNNNRLKVSLLLASSLPILASAILSPALPDMKENFQSMAHADVWVKALVTLPGLIIAIVAPFIGRCVDHVSKQRVLILSLFLYGVSGVIGFLFADKFALLLLSRIMLGLAVAGAMISIATIASSCFKGQELSQFLGLQAAFGSFGGVVFLAMGGVLAEFHWTYPLLVYCIAFVLIFPIKNQHTVEADSPKEHAGAYPKMDGVMKTALVGWAFLAFFEVFTLYMLPIQLPFLLNEFGFASSTLIGGILAVIFFIVALVSTQYSKIQSKVSFLEMHAIGYVCIAAGYFVVGFTSNLVVLLVGASICAVGFGLVRPNLMMWLFSGISPAHKGMAIGILTSLFFVAQFISPLVFSVIGRNVNLSQLFVVAALLCLPLVVFLFVRSFVISKVQQLA